MTLPPDQGFQAIGKVFTGIHPADQMWNTGQEWYFAVGESALRVIRLAVAASWLSEVRSILDLPCGHGRVARYLRAAYPTAQLYFCDLDQSGVEFCANTFAGSGILSKPELAEVGLPSVDVIWVGSLFTHVDQIRCERWLAHLAAHLSPQGVLVATFHGLWSHEVRKKHPMLDDASWAEVLRGYERTGFGYAPYRGAEAVDYGVSLTRPSVVCEMATAIRGVRILGYMERGWADNHDVLILSKNDRLASW